MRRQFPRPIAFALQMRLVLRSRHGAGRCSHLSFLLHDSVFFVLLSSHPSATKSCRLRLSNAPLPSCLSRSISISLASVSLLSHFSLFSFLFFSLSLSLSLTLSLSLSLSLSKSVPLLLTPTLLRVVFVLRAPLRISRPLPSSNTECSRLAFSPRPPNQLPQLHPT